MWELILSFHYVDPGTQIQVIRLGGKHPYPLSHLAGPSMLIILGSIKTGMYIDIVHAASISIFPLFHESIKFIYFYFAWQIY